MTEHRASCQCGQLRATASEDPEFVIACNCSACKKRTGAPFGAGGYFRKEHFSTEGNHKSWTRQADSGKTLTNHFCPDCGTNLFWTLEMRPDHVAIALGNFDTGFPTPWRVVWMKRKLDWVHFPDSWERYEMGSPYKQE